MRRYQHKALGVIIEVESEIGGEWVELVPHSSEKPVQTEEEKPKKKRTTKAKK